MFDRLQSDAERREEAARLRRDLDLHHLRILAWCVARARYSADPVVTEGGHRGRTRLRTFTFTLEQADFAEANEAVRDLVRRRSVPAGVAIVTPPGDASPPDPEPPRSATPGPGGAAGC